jgi:hypothetical protein
MVVERDFCQDKDLTPKHFLPFLISRVAVYSELGKTLSFSLIADSL